MFLIFSNFHPHNYFSQKASLLEIWLSNKYFKNQCFLSFLHKKKQVNNSTKFFLLVVEK